MRFSSHHFQLLQETRKSQSIFLPLPITSLLAESGGANAWLSSTTSWQEDTSVHWQHKVPEECNKPHFPHCKTETGRIPNGDALFSFSFFLVPPQRPTRVSGSATAPERKLLARLPCAETPINAHKQMLPRGKTPPRTARPAAVPSATEAAALLQPHTERGARGLRGRKQRCRGPALSGAPAPPGAVRRREAAGPRRRRGVRRGRRSLSLRRPRVSAEPEEGAPEVQPAATLRGRGPARESPRARCRTLPSPQPHLCRDIFRPPDGRRGLPGAACVAMPAPRPAPRGARRGWRGRAPPRPGGGGGAACRRPEPPAAAGLYPSCRRLRQSAAARVLPKGFRTVKNNDRIKASRQSSGLVLRLRVTM